MSKEQGDAKADLDLVVDVSSGDDTDYETVDDYKQLEPKVLETHLNCSAESGLSVITVVEDDDLQIIEEKFKERNETTDYNNDKYFNKKRQFHIMISDNPTTGNSSRSEILSGKLSKMEKNCADDVQVTETERNIDPEDVKSYLTNDNLRAFDDNLGVRDKEMLAKLEKIRRWRLTGLGEAYQAGEKKECETDMKFRVLSYNILAQKNLTDHQNLYRGKQQYLLEWAYRWTGIKREVQTYNPDIVTLQEVQFSGPDYFSQDIRPWFTQVGYEAASQCRTGDKVDGCAIFFKTAKFSLITSHGVEYKQEDAQVLSKDNVGLVCCLKATNGARLAVATTHLLFNPKRHEIRLAQSALLLAELDRLAQDTGYQGGYMPVILTGDLNLLPYSDTYNLITKGTVSYAGLVCGRSVLPDQLLPEHLGVTDTCQHVADMSSSCQAPEFGSGTFSHKFGFRSAYHHSRHQDTRVPVGGYEATTFHGSWVTVDYIFYSTVKAGQSTSRDGRQEGKLKLLGRLALLTGPEISAIGGLPSSICPSDHLPLMAEFNLKI